MTSLWANCCGLDASQTCHAKPKTQINRRRTLPTSFPLVGCPQAAWPERLLSEKSGRWHYVANWGVALYWVKSWWYPSGNRPLQQYLTSLPGAGPWLIERQADSLIANSKKRAERSERLMYEQVTAIISALVICIIVCLSRAVNHYRDNAITYKAQRDKKYAENWSWRTQQLLTCRCVSVMLLRSMQNTRVSWC